MLSVMLVDDESILRTGLKQAFDWKKVGCEVIAEADDGLKAYELYQKLHPDIIITDIRMSRSDGLELMSMLKGGEADSEVIVLSGYDNFSYARQALESGVFAYLLKPVNLSELADTICALKKKIENRKKTDTAVSAYTTLRTEEMIMHLINSDNCDELIKNNSDFLDRLPKNYIVAVIEADNKRTISDRLIKVSLCLKESTDYVISTSENYIVKCVLEQTKYILTIFTKDSYAYDSAVNSLRELLSSFAEFSGTTATIGISGVFRSLKMLGKAYDQAEQALRKKALLGNNRIIDFIRMHTGSMGEHELTKEQMNAVTDALKANDYSGAHTLLDEYFLRIHSCSDLSIDNVRNSIAELAIMIINATAKNTDIMQIIYGRIVNPVAELSEIELLSDIHKWILALTDALENSDSIYNHSIKNETVKKAVNFIITYYDKPLTIEWVATKMYVSPRHISRCFKQELGITFNEYLTRYRMSKAESLLSDSQYKMYEVAQLVGYNDSKYFCKLFKKQTGRSPQSYRQ